MPIIRESEGRDLVHEAQSAQCGTKTVGIPQYELTINNEEQPQPEPPVPPVPPVVIPVPGKAVSPTPGDESVTGNYPFGLVLSWANGGGATSYVVWLNGVFQGTTTTSSFAPSLLVVSTTYSWRVDSLNDGGITIGDTWTFTTAGQVYPPTPPLPAVNVSPADGDLAVDPAAVTLSWSNGGGAISYDIYLNGVFQANQSGTSFLVGALSGTTSYTWRIDSVNAQGTTLGTVWAFTTTSGVLPPAKAINPAPADGLGTVDPEATLFGWDDGGGATSYDVYVNGVFQVNQVATIFDPGILTSFASYTWRIDSVNVAGTTTGDTWTFDTVGHATVVSWASRVVTNGGAAPAVATKRALHVFCVGLDSASLTASMIAVNCFAADDLTAAITPLIVGPGSDPWTNHGPFAGADLTVNGLVGNGTTKWLGTGVKQTAYSSDTNAGVTVYNSVATSDAVACADTGSNGQAGGGSKNSMFSVNLSGTAYWDNFNNIAGQGRLSVANSSWSGYSSANRVAANDSQIFQANSGTPHYSLGSIATAGGVRDNVYEHAVFAHNAEGTLALFSPHRLSFVAFHSGLTAAQSSDFFDLIQALRTALGGGYV